MGTAIPGTCPATLLETLCGPAPDTRIAVDSVSTLEYHARHPVTDKCCLFKTSCDALDSSAVAAWFFGQTTPLEPY
jgi:hypothetical protein